MYIISLLDHGCVYLQVVSDGQQAAAKEPDDLPLDIFGLVVDLVAEEFHGIFHRHVVIALAQVISMTPAFS